MTIMWPLPRNRLTAIALTAIVTRNTPADAALLIPSQEEADISRQAITAEIRNRAAAAAARRAAATTLIIPPIPKACFLAEAEAADKAAEPEAAAAEAEAQEAAEAAAADAADAAAAAAAASIAERVDASDIRRYISRHRSRSRSHDNKSAPFSL